MDRQQQFRDRVSKVAELLATVDKSKPVRVISHFDADGITACALVIKALHLKGFTYLATIVKQLTHGILYDLSREKAETIIFCDLGSGELDKIQEILKGKMIFVIDHHRINGDYSGVVLLNPEEFEISGSKEISASGVAYFLYREITKKNRLAHLAIVGAMGDYQEHNGFSELNKEILEEAKKDGLIRVVEGLRIPCLESIPINKALEFCVDPLIPGVSGTEIGASKFLQDIGAQVKVGLKWKKVSELKEKESRQIAAGIIERRLGVDKPEQIYGPVYILTKEKSDSPTKNAAEFANLLDACGRMDKASLGLCACLGDESCKMRAVSVLNQYRRELVENLQWFEKSRKDKDANIVIEDKKYVIINAKNKIRDTMLGALATALTSNPEYATGKLILTMGQDDDMIKVSLRVAGKLQADLKKILELMVLPAKGRCGGHKSAAGGRFPIENEADFIENAKRVLEKFSAEETVG